MKYITTDDFQIVDDKCRKVSAMLMDLIKTLRHSNFRTLTHSFTLMELIVVMAVLIVLGGILIPQVNRVITEARKAKAKAELEHIKSAMLSYKDDVGQLPPSGSNPVEGNLDGSTAASALLSNDGSSGWNGPYIEKSIGKDPWGNSYRYEDNDGTTIRPISYLLSYGPDGAKDVTDPHLTTASNFDDDIYVVVYNDGD